jgi:hypothetical protein
MDIYIYREREKETYIYIYTHETCAWSPNNIWGPTLEGQAQWANKTIWDAFSGILAFRLLTARLRHLGSGTWQPAILEYRLLAAGLRHLA